MMAATMRIDSPSLERIDRMLARHTYGRHGQAGESLDEQAARVRRVDDVVDVEPPRGAQRGMGARQRLRLVPVKRGAQPRVLDRVELFLVNDVDGALEPHPAELRGGPLPVLDRALRAGMAGVGAADGRHGA